MSKDERTGKVKIQGRIPRDEFEEYDRLQRQWGIDNGDAFRRVFSAGLDAVEERTLDAYLKMAVVNLAVIAAVMWVLGRVMPNIPADSASMAAFVTFGIAAAGIILIGAMNADWSRRRTGTREAAD